MTEKRRQILSGAALLFAILATVTYVAAIILSAIMLGTIQVAKMSGTILALNHSGSIVIVLATITIVAGVIALYCNAKSEE